MKKNLVIENLKNILIEKINTLDLDELRATYFALLPVTADPELKDLLFGEPEPDEDTDDLPVVKYYGSEICNSEPAEDTLLEKVPPHYNDTEPAHYNDTAPAKKPELPKGTPSGECWVITRSYGFIPDGPGYDITGDELIYGIYDSWEPAIKEFRNISEREQKEIDEGPGYYKISCWNPKTGTAGYTLKKHGVNGTRADEDEFCELLYAAAAESAALGMAAFTDGNLPELANEIANLSGDIDKNVSDAKKMLGDELPGTIKTAADAAKETLRQLIALMAKLAE